MSKQEIANALGKTLNAIKYVLRRNDAVAARPVCSLAWEGDADLVPWYDDVDVSEDRSRLVSIRVMAL